MSASTDLPPVVTALLCRYDLSIIEQKADVDGFYGRREGFVQFGGFRDEQQVRSLAARILGVHANHRETRVINGAILTDPQLPEYGFRLGDTFNGDLVVGYTISADANGNALIDPQLTTHLETLDESFDAILTRAASGAGSNSSVPSVADNPSGSGSNQEPPAFSQDGNVTDGHSQPWAVKRPYQLAWIEASLDVASDSPFTINVWDDFFTVGSISVPAGVQKFVGAVDHCFAPSTFFTFEVSGSDESASKLTISPRGAMV